MTRAAVAGAALLLLLLVPAGGLAAEPRLHVFAASSLTEAFRRYDARQAYNLAGSNQLAFQIRRGAKADVFASASPTYTRDLFRRRLVERPRVLATNRLVIIVPRSNPMNVRTVHDLHIRGAKLVVAGPQVPAGAYTRQALRRLGLSFLLENVVSEEPDVKGVVAKVALGRADAGFVYATDARAAAARLRTIGLPAFAQPKIRYEIAVVRKSAHKTAARAWVERMTKSPRARRLLRQAGFGLP